MTQFTKYGRYGNGYVLIYNLSDIDAAIAENTSCAQHKNRSSAYGLLETEGEGHSRPTRLRQSSRGPRRGNSIVPLPGEAVSSEIGIMNNQSHLSVPSEHYRLLSDMAAALAGRQAAKGVLVGIFHPGDVLGTILCEAWRIEDWRASTAMVS